MSEKLDAWGEARIDAIKTYERAGNRYWRQGSRAKAVMADALGAAAELAPHSWKGVILDLAPLGLGAASKILKLTKLGRLAGPLARTNPFRVLSNVPKARKMVQLGQQINRVIGNAPQAKALGQIQRAKEVVSATKALHKMTEVAHLANSLFHSGKQIAQTKIRNAPTKQPQVKPQNSPIRKLIAPTTITNPSPLGGSIRRGAPKVHQPPKTNLAAAQLRLRQPKLGQSLVHRQLGLHVPKLHINRALSAMAKAPALIRPPSRPARLNLHAPRLGSSLGFRRPSFAATHRAPVRAFRR